MFRFLKNHLQGACFALLKLLVLISFHYFEWCGSMHYVTPEAICGCVFLNVAFDTVPELYSEDGSLRTETCRSLMNLKKNFKVLNMF